MKGEERSEGCCGPNCGCGVTRRDVLKQGAAAAGALAASPYMARAFAGPFGAGDSPDHFVPAKKKLDPQWVKLLTARGERTWYSGEELSTIGMPVGGICAGQVYLTGDGRLVYWDIFNSNHNTGYGRINYQEGRTPTDVAAGGGFVDAPRIEHSFSIRAKVSGEMYERGLDRGGFPAVRFAGEYPLGMVEYRDEQFPIEIDQVAFSPFIPLDSDNSSLPCVVQQFHVRNRGNGTAHVSLTGTLENVILREHVQECMGQAQRIGTRINDDGCSGVHFAARIVQREPQTVREPVVFADFESESYGDWRVEGEALGAGPAAGTLERQNPVSGFRGRGLVNTYRGGSDAQTGKLISPAFTIERPWIGFLIGGGGHAGRTCMNLIVDDTIVRTATGRNAERLTARSWNVEELRGKTARLEIVDEETGGWGHINIDQIEFRDEPMPGEIADVRRLRDFGTMALVVVERTGASAAVRGESAREAGGGPACEIDEPMPGDVTKDFELQPGEERTVTFVTSWHFANQYQRQPWNEEQTDALVGQHYAARFGNAAAVARHVAANLDELAGATRRWHEVYYDSTLPHWLLDRVGATTCNLATTTCQWWRDGRFWAWEGCGCCHGTCGHVWNYAHTLARLFPDLERSAREMQDFAPGVGFDPETGRIGFRGEGWPHWAGDSQAGYILKAYREHQCSRDDAFLRRNWASIKKALQFLIEQDGDDDGLIEGRQHNTYDIDYYGANTMVGSLYLAALRAAEEMASEVGDASFAEACRQLSAQGKKRSVDLLYNGEYFVQDVDLETHPEWQYKDGCLADQLFGQSWAHQVGVGYVYPQETVRSALTAIWKYCWAPDIARQNEAHPPERWFARAGEAGLLTCTWPRTKHLGPRSTRYRDEVWTGIEYQVASHMAWEGMLTEALAICRAVHDRYHPSKRNPFNEVECGDHYARALASWGVLTGLAGFGYHGPQQRLAFAPRLRPERFKSVFTTAEAWGSYEQSRTVSTQRCALHVAFGRLALRQIRVSLPTGSRLARLEVRHGTNNVAVAHVQKEEAVTISFTTGIEITEAEQFDLTLHFA